MLRGSPAARVTDTSQAEQVLCQARNDQQQWQGQGRIVPDITRGKRTARQRVAPVPDDQGNQIFVSGPCGKLAERREEKNASVEGARPHRPSQNLPDRGVGCVKTGVVGSKEASHFSGSSAALTVGETSTREDRSTQTRSGLRWCSRSSRPGVRFSGVSGSAPSRDFLENTHEPANTFPDLPGIETGVAEQESGLP